MINITRPLGVACYNLDFVCGDGVVIYFQSGIFDDKCPHVVAKSVRMQMALQGDCTRGTDTHTSVQAHTVHIYCMKGWAGLAL